jgi:hypothetical protein
MWETGREVSRNLHSACFHLETVVAAHRARQTKTKEDNGANSSGTG